MRKHEKLGWLNGIYLATKEAKLILDPVRYKVDEDAYILISHAHADHTRGFNSPNIKLSTVETKRIFEVLRQKEVKRYTAIELGETIELGNIKVKALNSGHMLGSTQFLIETPEKVILYTGDMNCVDTLTTIAAESVECDILIIEGTYGRPMYNFPPREGVYSEMVKWALKNVNEGKTPVIRAYAAGKAQEIVKLFNDYTTVPIVVDDKVASVNEVFNDYSDELHYSVEIDNCDEFKASIHVVANPHPSTTNNFKLVVGHATGWALNNSRGGNFPLSSHADFYQLLEFIEDSSAKETYVFTGFNESFATYIKKKTGVDAKPIPPITQRRLMDFK